MIYQLAGLCLFVLGLSHKLDPANRLDTASVKFLQGKLGQPPLLKWFKDLWFFGRTIFALVMLVLLAGYDWKLGLSALVVFGIVVGLETVVKMTFKRSRPYSVIDDIQMFQPQEPIDSSFPSGDALRIWFLVITLSIALGNSLLFWIFSAILAILVSMGRMILGVHYLTDVLAGAGLGILGAGTTIWLWHYFQLL